MKLSKLFQCTSELMDTNTENVNFCLFYGPFLALSIKPLTGAAFSGKKNVDGFLCSLTRTDYHKSFHFSGAILSHITYLLQFSKGRSAAPVGKAHPFLDVCFLK